MLEAGLHKRIVRTVREEHLASAVGSGAAPVFSTPALVALCEEAAFSGVQPYLREGQSTVGTRIEIRHLAATPPGQKVRASATLVSVEGRRLLFRVEAWDEVELIGVGEHERFIIDEARFMARVEGKRAAD